MYQPTRYVARLFTGPGAQAQVLDKYLPPLSATITQINKSIVFCMGRAAWFHGLSPTGLQIFRHPRKWELSNFFGVGNDGKGGPTRDTVLDTLRFIWTQKEVN